MNPRWKCGRRFTAGIVVGCLTFAMRLSSAHAYATWSDGCVGCHGDFRSDEYVSQTDGTNWGTDLMSGHSGFMGSGTCNVCHKPPSGTPRSPVYIGISAGISGYSPISCLGCHGRADDASGECVIGNSATINPANCGMGAGLRAHHANAGIEDCADCHADPVPVGEDVNPSYYFTPDAAHPNKPVNSCNAAGSSGKESKFGPLGLDNDGDHLVDQDDPDCQAPAVCGDGSKSPEEACDDGNNTDGDCCSATCDFEPSTTPCRGAIGVCDLAEFCTGTSAGCPADAAAGTTTLCRASSGECDLPESCNGIVKNCPANAFVPASTPCSSDGNVCTSDACNGASPACQHAANSANCDDGLFCNGADTCEAGLCATHAGDPCSGPDGDGECSESCAESTDSCTAADPDASPCTDDDACTLNDTCSGGICIGTPVPDCSVTTTTLPLQQCGDATGDGKITAADALHALRAAVGTAECTLQVCDYNGNGSVTASDALDILRVAVGQIIPPMCPDAALAWTTAARTGSQVHARPALTS